MLRTAPIWGIAGPAGIPSRKQEHQAPAPCGSPDPTAQGQGLTRLDPGITLADVSTWADEVRPSRPDTGPWHYVNIPRGSAGYSARSDCSHGCVVSVSAIDQSLRLLQDPTKCRAVRQQALKWIVQFVADLHQPLHAIADDRGGNNVILQFNGRQTNLHRLWDVDVIERAYPSQRVLQDQVVAVIQMTNWRAWQVGGPADWAEETHRVAIEAVYLFPASQEIDDRYMEKVLPVIHEQLAKAAVQLVGVLSRVLAGN